MAVTRSFLLLFLLFCCTIAVTVIPIKLTLPRPYESVIKPASSSEGLLQSILHTDGGFIDASNLGWINQTDGIYPLQDSFVRSAIDAGIHQQHLVIRPEDVWLTILTQITFYLRKHKEDKEVWDKFDNLQGNTSEVYSWLDFWPGELEKRIEREIKLRNKTDWLIEWVQPNFSTSTTVDGMIFNAVMMASSTPSSDEIAPFTCGGIPSITLLGTKKDWERLLLKFDRMGEFGVQPAQYRDNLHPILSRFVTTFQNPIDEHIRQFWSNIVAVESKRSQCTTTKTRMLTGWINGLHYWDATGNLLSHDQAGPSEERFTLDSKVYPWQNIQNLPAAYSNFRVCWQGSNPINKDSKMLVGMIAKSIRKGIPDGYEAALRRANLTLPSTVAKSDHSILRPLSAYFVHGKPPTVLSTLFSKIAYMFWLTKFARHRAEIVEDLDRFSNDKVAYSESRTRIALQLCSGSG